MSKTLQARISRIEAQIKAKPQTFDYHAAYGVDRAKYETGRQLRQKLDALCYPNQEEPHA